MTDQTSASPSDAPKKDQEELTFWLDKLKSDHSFLSRRNVRLFIFLSMGLIVFALLLYMIHSNTIGQYAVLDNIRLEQHNASQGQIRLAFDVKTPGKVLFERESGPLETSRMDTYMKPQHVDRYWNWSYQPGKPITVNIVSRRGLMPRFSKAKFQTSTTIDVVILIDVTESMTEHIDTLKKKVAAFAIKLHEQYLQPRFALIGFSDSVENEWVTSFDFTTSEHQLLENLEKMKRYNGGDLPESALDALDLATGFSFEDGSMRRFYLITDQDYHPTTKAGLDAEAVYKKLAEKKVFLEVFSRSDFEAQYMSIIRDSGKFQEIENFGEIFSRGKILED